MAQVQTALAAIEIEASSAKLRDPAATCLVPNAHAAAPPRRGRSKPPHGRHGRQGWRAISAFLGFQAEGVAQSGPQAAIAFGARPSAWRAARKARVP